jgi:hypothetical protein
MKIKKYKVEFTQTETFIVDVYAKSKKEAEEKATEQFDRGNYQEVGDCSVSIGNVREI